MTANLKLCKFVSYFPLFINRSYCTGSSKWNYSDDEIRDIVNHMQKLALLKPDYVTKIGDNPPETNQQVEEKEKTERQVTYLKSMMRIAHNLSTVNTTGIEPLHNIPQVMINHTHLRPDYTHESSSSDTRLTPKIERGNYVHLPPIPAGSIISK